MVAVEINDRMVGREPRSNDGMRISICSRTRSVDVPMDYLPDQKASCGSGWYAFGRTRAY